MIRLGNCFDLLDPETARDLTRFYKTYEQTFRESGRKLPKNVMSHKRLNCAAFQFAYEALGAQGQPIDTCRAVFLPTKDSKRKAPADKMLWTGCGINPMAHVQVCVREPSCILGTWLVKPIEA